MTSAQAKVDAHAALRILGPAFFDAWFLIDDQERILEFNAAFHSLFPRTVARSLKNQNYRQVLSLAGCGEQSLRDRCAAEGGRIRLDEIECTIGDETLQFSVSAVTVALPDDLPGTLIILRNVTDEARVQSQYQQMVEAAERERRDLEERLAARTRELVSSNTELNRLERELARLRRKSA